MLFILKKKKEKKKKKNVSNKRGKMKKTQLTNPFCTKPEGEEARQEPRSKGPQLFEELDELFKDYFHMAVSDIEELAVRDT